MTQLSYLEKVEKLKQLSASNFTNRTMLMLTGAEDFLTQERYKEAKETSVKFGRTTFTVFFFL